MALFVNGMGWDGKQNGIVVNVIDMREKNKNILQKKVKKFVLQRFFYLKNDKK